MKGKTIGTSAPCARDSTGSAEGLMNGQLLTRIIPHKVDQGMVVGVNVSVGMSVGDVMSIGPGPGSIGISGQTA